LDIEKSFLDGGLSGEAAKWSGYHTGLKPAIEDWWLVRKPLEGTIIENILKYGTGALDIDSSRVFTDWDEPDRPDTWKKSGHSAKPEAVKVAAPPGTGINCHPLGRWPADFILSHSPKCQRVGTKVLKGDPRGNCKGTRPGGFYAPGSDSGDGKPNAYVYGDQEIPIYECVDGCPVGILDRDSDNSRYFKTFDPDPEANFIYQAKPSTTEKNADLDEGLVNEHKTVKSLKLMSYLVRLVTPQGGYVLDPFAGSGTTLVAAAELNLGFLGIEKDDKTWPVLQNRVANVIKRLEQEREKSAVFDAMLELESE
jgi:site-specific DNA-methyltransferase (adenine-specific)